MKTEKLTITIDKEMAKCISLIKEKIKTEQYPIKSWNKFFETSLLMFSKILDNGISPFDLELFIETNKKNDSIFDA